MNDCLFASSGMNRRLNPSHYVHHEEILRRFFGPALQFIPHEPRTKTLIPFIYNASSSYGFRAASLHMSSNVICKLPDYFLTVT